MPPREMTENVRTSDELVFNQIEREELADITLTLGNIDSPYCRDKPGVAIDDLYKASRIYALIALAVCSQELRCLDTAERCIFSCKVSATIQC